MQNVSFIHKQKHLDDDVTAWRTAPSVTE